eukprot:6188584-Pleurochrysis_carterae.AAC.1
MHVYSTAFFSSVAHHEPTSHLPMHGRGRVAVPSVSSGAPVPVGEAGEYVERKQLVSEWLLLHQLARAFLSQPWLQPDAGHSRTQREAPPGGWAFPLISSGAAHADAQPGESLRPGDGMTPVDSQVDTQAESSQQRDFPANLPALSPLGEGGVPWSNVVLPAIDADTNDVNVAGGVNVDGDGDDENHGDSADANANTDAVGGERSNRDAKPQGDGTETAAGAAGAANAVLTHRGAIYVACECETCLSSSTYLEWIQRRDARKRSSRRPILGRAESEPPRALICSSVWRVDARLHALDAHVRQCSGVCAARWRRRERKRRRGARGAADGRGGGDRVRRPER